MTQNTIFNATCKVGSPILPDFIYYKINMNGCYWNSVSEKGISEINKQKKKSDSSLRTVGKQEDAFSESEEHTLKSEKTS